MPFSEAPTVAAQEPCDPFACPPPPGPPTAREVVLGIAQSALQNNPAYNLIPPMVQGRVNGLLNSLINRFR
jgi:hypothetical protein